MRDDLSVPRVWLVPQDNGAILVSPYEDIDGIAVDMNASLYRQIIAAYKKYRNHQDLLAKFYNEALEHPDQIRRVK